MDIKKSIAALLLFIPLMSSAQKTLTASGDYTYYGPTTITPEQAKAIALERAKIQIIADNFGTIVGVNNSTFISNTSESSSVSFLSLGESEVKGEWIRTVGTPDFAISYEQNLQIVKVHVTGMIRELKSARIQFNAKILRNGTSDRYESDEFKAGDDLYVSFVSPVDGYVAVYLYDQSGVCRLLPLKYQKEGSIRVEGGQRSVFFTRHSTVFSPAENRYAENTYSEYVMTCSRELEINRIYVIFSPNRFSRPLDNISADEQDMPASLSFDSFQEWLAKSRKQDVDMSVKVADIVVRQQ